MAAYGLVQKKIRDELPRHIDHVCKNKQNSPAYFLARNRRKIFKLTYLNFSRF